MKPKLTLPPDGVGVHKIVYILSLFSLHSCFIFNFRPRCIWWMNIWLFTVQQTQANQKRLYYIFLCPISSCLDSCSIYVELVRTPCIFVWCLLLQSADTSRARWIMNRVGSWFGSVIFNNAFSKPAWLNSTSLFMVSRFESRNML